MALFDEPKVRSASVKAVEDTELIILLSFSIDQLSRSYPEIVSEIKKVIEERKRQNKLNLN
jgi:CRP-like cAMP-binding protein